MANLAGFSKELDDFANAFVQEAEHLVKETTKEVIESLVTDTRRDTGRAKSSYVASLDVPQYQVAYDVTRKNRVDDEEGLRRSLQTVENVSEFHLGQLVWVANGAPYISYLEDGGVHDNRDYGHGDHMFSNAIAKYATHPNFTGTLGR